MSDDSRPVILKSTMDASGVRPGAEEVKKTVRDMAADVGAAARQAAAGVEGIGEGGERGAQKLDAEARRMVASIQRATAAAQSGGRQTADYYETLAKQRGIGVDQLRPYLDGLRTAEAAQAAATGSLDRMGLSAKQTAAALRQVPAQFTDIFTSLASGQAPLTVLLQQGGQLKDVFGGAAPAAQALGGYIASLITPTTLLGAGVVALAAGYALGSQEAQEFTKAIVLTGNAAGVTADQLADMARAIASGGPITQSKAAEVLTIIAAAGDVAANSIQRYTQAAIELERAGGPAAAETAKAFSALARDPLQASLKLTESTRYLTAATAEQILELERQGRSTEAARVAQEAYAQALEQRAPELAARLGLVERAWQGIKDATKQAGDALLDVGRPETLDQQIQSLQAAIDSYQRLQGADGGGLIGAFARGREQALRAEQAALVEQQRLQGRSAELAAERNRREQDGIRFLREGEKYLSSQEKLRREIVAAVVLGNQAGKTEEEIARRINEIRAAAAGSSGNTAERERARALEQQARLVAELSGVTTSYAQDLAALDEVRRRGNVSEERYGELVRELVSRQPAVRANAQALARAAEEQARGVERAEKAYADYIRGLQATVRAGDQQLENLRDEYVAMTAGRAVLAEIQILRLENAAIAADEAANIAALNGEEQAFYQRRAEQLREEIRLRRGLAAASDQQQVRDANERAAREATEEWQRGIDQVGQSLADALLNGGRSAGELLRDYFRTLILKPIIEAEVRSLVGGIQSALGLAGGAGGGVQSSASGAGGLLSSAASALGLGKLAGSLGSIGKVIGPAVSQALIGRALGQAISGGYSLNGGSGNSAVNIGLLLGGPLGAIAGGVVNRLFGRKLKDFGFEGSFGAEGDFAGNEFQFLKGGVFRSNKTKRSPLDDALEATLDAGGRAALAQAEAYATALGLPVEALSGYTQKIKVSLKGLSEEEAQKALADAVQSYQEGLLGNFRAQLVPLQRFGETLSDTAARLAELQVFTRSINELGGVFARVAGLSVDAREQLASMAGGLDALQQQALSFVQQYYSREEIAGIKAREIQGVLAAAGITQDIATRDQFRALVDGTDVSSEAGRQRLAQLLAIGSDFAQVADYLAEVGGSLATAAAGAPATGQIAELFTQPQQAQIDAINSVATGVQQTNTLLGQLIDAVQSARGAVFAPPSWEVGGA